MMLVSSQTQRQWKCGKEKKRRGHKEEKGTTHQKRTKEEEEREQTLKVLESNDFQNKVNLKSSLYTLNITNVEVPKNS